MVVDGTEEGKGGDWGSFIVSEADATPLARLMVGSTHAVLVGAEVDGS